MKVEKHLKFRKDANIVLVKTVKGDILGCIEYYLKWKELIFVPEQRTIWSSGCLQEITDKMEKLKKEGWI